MIEEALINYGVLGIWTLSLLYERYISNKKRDVIIEHNTVAMTKIYEVMNKCKKI